jgi:HSP20 family protein
MANDILQRRSGVGLNRLNNLFKGVFGDTGLSSGLREFEKSFQPTLDLSESEESYLIELEAPGLERDQIDISISDHVLTIKGQKEETDEREERDYHRVERRFGTFTRQVAVPEIDKAKDIEATYKKGVLSVTIPKSKEEQTQQIEIDVQES